jgi:hypothetical protein
VAGSSRIKDEELRMDDVHVARQMWHLLEPVHAILYYAPEAFEEAARLGYSVDGRWPSYFAWRGAVLGPAGEHAVTSAFYSFSPAMVRKYVPDAWRVAAPETVLQARQRAVDAALRSVLGPEIESSDMVEAASLGRRVARMARMAGRPLAAGNADLAWPEEPHLVLWHAATILREHRGDGHVSALLTADLDPVEALVSFAAVGAAPAVVFASREWTDDEWERARQGLQSRGLVDGQGQATAEGFQLRESVERVTDELAAPAWRSLGPEIARFARVTAPITTRIARSGLLPAQSTLGIRR